MTPTYELYTDGGVVQRNPSPIGGTWACRYLKDGVVIGERSGSITNQQAGQPVTNNLTEMLAVIEGLSRLPADWTGTIYSDSEITLGRIFREWKWTGIPAWLHKRYQAQVKRLVHWQEIRYVRLDGHPTKAQLEAGIGKRGGPVSIHNAWRDFACGMQAKKLLGELDEQKEEQQALREVMV